MTQYDEEYEFELNEQVYRESEYLEECKNFDAVRKLAVDLGLVGRDSQTGIPTSLIEDDRAIRKDSSAREYFAGDVFRDINYYRIRRDATKRHVKVVKKS